MKPNAYPQVGVTQDSLGMFPVGRFGAEPLPGMESEGGLRGEGYCSISALLVVLLGIGCSSTGSM